MLDHYEYFEHPKVADQVKPNIQSNKQNKPTDVNEVKDEAESRTSDTKKNQGMIFEINNSARNNNLSESKSTIKRKKMDSDDFDNKHEDKDDFPHIDLKIHLEKVDKHDSKYGSASKNDDVNDFPREYAEHEPMSLNKSSEQIQSPVIKVSNSHSVSSNVQKLNAEPERLSDVEDSLMHKLNRLHDKSEHIYDSLLE